MSRVGADAAGAGRVVTAGDSAAPGTTGPTARLASLWARHGTLVLSVLAAHALITAVLRLRGALNALLFVPDAPIDLLIRMEEVRRWFAGITIYGDAHSANYPPASYTLLWPVIGWLPEGAGRWLFALTLLFSLVTIAVIAVRGSALRGWPARAFVALFVLPLGATQITMWIGQLGLHVVACLLGAAALLFHTRMPVPAELEVRSSHWIRDLAASALLAASLIKPTLSVPVVVAVLVITGRWRPALFTAAFYIGLSLIAAAFQESSPFELALMWLGREEIMNLPLGSVNTHLWLHWLGVDGSLLAVSFVWLLACTLLSWRFRSADPWLIVGFAALVGRLWIHHRAFDDVLLIIPAIALLRIAGGSIGATRSIVAGALVALIYALGHAPYAWLSGENASLWLITEVGRTVAWLAALVFLVWHIRRSAGSPAHAT